MSPINLNSSDSNIYNPFARVKVPNWLQRASKYQYIKSYNSKGNYENVDTDEDNSKDNVEDKVIELVETKNTTVGSDLTFSIIKPIEMNKIYETALAWVSISLAVLSGSAIGPMFKYMTNEGISPLLAASWRCQCMVLWLAPLAIIEFLSSKPEDKIDWFQYKPGLKFPVFVHVIIAGIVWAGSLLTWIIGLQYTSTVTASLITGMHPLILVFVLHFSGNTVSSLEWIGVLTAIIGIFIASTNSIYEITESKGRMSLIGDLFCLVAAICEVLVILNRQKIKKYVPLMQYTTITTLQVAITAGILSVILENSNGHVFCMSEKCIFGWTSKDWLGPMLLFGLIIGLFCMSGFNYAMQYISPLVFSSVCLLDPAVTGLISWVAGIEGVPDMFTWIGGIAVICGIGIVLIGENKRVGNESKLSKSENESDKSSINYDIVVQID